MKKILFVFAAFLAVSFASCGGNTQADGANDTDSVVVDSVIDTLVVDSIAADSVCAD